MSADRNATRHQPLRPALASNRTTRSPLAPRVTATGSTPTSRPPGPRATPSTRSEPAPPRVKGVSSPNNDAPPTAHVTPRSSARNSRVEGANTTPTHDEEPPGASRTHLSTERGLRLSPSHVGERNGGDGQSFGVSGRPTSHKANSVTNGVSISNRSQTHSVRSPGFADLSHQSPDESIESRFFHASDAPKHEPLVSKKPQQQAKKSTAFFHADGKEEARLAASPKPTSPVLSAVSDKRASGPWIRSDGNLNHSKSPPTLSPAYNGSMSSEAASGWLSSFGSASGQAAKPRSPSPSKENIHLSYRKGASQIFGPRPTQQPPSAISNPKRMSSSERSVSFENPLITTPHRNSPSLSSIDSGNSSQPRRRSATTAEINSQQPSPLTQEITPATRPRLAARPATSRLPEIDTSHPPPGDSHPAFSPTKGVSDLAADARRERKVLDLEISNSSLMAINSSLEREVRKQKSELKRFRRLSRAGRLSTAIDPTLPRRTDALPTVGEEEDDDASDADTRNRLPDPYDDFSDSDPESDADTASATSSSPLSPTTAQSRRHSARLAKDEQRLQVDLEKHKELLVQSQSMNQSLRRCTYATEEMIREGRRAISYSVRVSDVKLGGRVLNGDATDDEGEQIDVDDDLESLRDGERDEGRGGGGDGAGRRLLEARDDVAEDHSAEQNAKSFLDVWTGLGGRPSVEGSDGDSGIEADRPPWVGRPAEGIGVSGNMGLSH